MDWHKKAMAFLSAKIFKILILAAFFFIFMAIAFIGTRPYIQALHEGDIAIRSLYAPFDFTCLGGIDELATRKAKEAAGDSIFYVYELDSTKRGLAVDEVSKFLEKAAGIKKDATLTADKKLTALKDTRPSQTDADLQAILGAEPIEEYSVRVVAFANDALSKFIIADEDLKRLKDNNISTITVLDAAGQKEAAVKIEELLTPDMAKRQIDELAEGTFTGKQRPAALNLIKDAIAVNLKENPEVYNKRKEQVAKAIPSIRREIQVKRNELIIEKGQRATNIHLAKLDELAKLQEKTSYLTYFIGLAILAVIFLILGIIYLAQYEYNLFVKNKNLILIGGVILLMLLLTKFVTQWPISSYLIPFSCGGMLLTILLRDARVAFMATVAMSIFTGIITGNSFDITMVALVSGCVGIYATGTLSKRGHLIRAGFLAGLAAFGTIVGMGLLNSLKPGVFFVEGLWGLAGGLLAAFVVIGVLPIFENLFNIVTNVTLLELLDMNHPLLKDLITKAPGTYHHSLIVGNLVEAACGAIGANALMARVGAYYHDVGKMLKPEYFSENEVDYQSRHDKLTPSMSTLIVINHVKDGVELAQKYKLNQSIIDFIEQHHGTSLAYYFYQRALEKGGTEAGPKEEDFRYPGPLPQTREVAVVMLADAVEAASRTLSDPTPARVEGLVQKIINNKFIDGQLNECELTLVDLNKISKSFVKILTGVFHARIEYPEPKQEA